MDFEIVLGELLAGLQRENIRYAVIGGFALTALGAPRATGDIDFLVHREDLSRLDGLMASLGYRKRFASENVSQYQGKDAIWGFVDVLHAFRPISLAMLERAKGRPVFSGRLAVRVLEPEDVIGLKVQGMACDPDRYSKDLADIEALLALRGASIDWNRIEEFFSLFRLDHVFVGLKKRFSDTPNA